MCFDDDDGDGEKREETALMGFDFVIEGLKKKMTFFLLGFLLIPQLNVCLQWMEFRDINMNLSI